MMKNDNVTEPAELLRADSVGQLCELLAGRGVQASEKELYWMSYNIPELYESRLIPKRDGGSRELYIPKDNLKEVQRCILSVLLLPMAVSEFACAYKPGSSIRANAAPHKGQRMVLKLDITKFFDSITLRHVYAAAFPPEYYAKPVGVLLANLCCCDGRLPQGAPTSPAISNLVLRRFDGYVGNWCRERNINYTRYCDDMTFSGDFDPGPVIGKVSGLLKTMGLELNREKTRIIRQGQRQAVTGVVVNEKLQAPAEYRRRIRQEVYYCEKFGVREHILGSGQTECVAEDPESRDGKQVDQKRFLRKLLGRIAYALSVNPEDQALQQCREKVRGWLAEEE